MVSNAGHHSQVQCRLLMKYTEDLANQIAITTVSAYLVVIQVRVKYLECFSKHELYNLMGDRILKPTNPRVQSF